MCTEEAFHARSNGEPDHRHFRIDDNLVTTRMNHVRSMCGRSLLHVSSLTDVCRIQVPNNSKLALRIWVLPSGFELESRPLQRGRSVKSSAIPPLLVCACLLSTDSLRAQIKEPDESVGLRQSEQAVPSPDRTAAIQKLAEGVKSTDE